MKYRFQMRAGDKIAILRPDDPGLAIRLAREAMAIESAEESEKALDAILHAQMYSFAGLVATVGKPERKLLNESGWAIGTCKPGDSMVPYRQIVEARDKAAQALSESKSVIQPTSVTLGDGKGGFRLEVGPDGKLGPIADTFELGVTNVETGVAETMKVGAWKATCECGGYVTATHDEVGPSGMLHSGPPCDDFVRMEPLEFVIWLNEKLSKRKAD